MTFNARHIAALDAIVASKARDDRGDLILSTTAWLGSACRSWAESVTRRAHPQLPVKRQNRSELRALVQQKELSDAETHLAVMAWGGQRRDHGRRTWESIDILKPLLSGLREGGLDRASGYQAFFDLTTRAERRVAGMGPAYYSKLLFFLPPETSGPIMDQWTAKSMQLLADRGSGPPVVGLSYAGHVSRLNGYDVYERFCTFVAALAARYGISEGNAEELIFAGSGQPWRLYVLAHWTRIA